MYWSWSLLRWHISCLYFILHFAQHVHAIGKTGDWKRSVFIPVPKKGNVKECSNYHIIALISHASKAMLKILQAKLQHHVNWELPDVQAGFRKGRGTREKNHQHLLNYRKSKIIPEKTTTSASLTTLKPLTTQIIMNCGKFFKRWEYQTVLPVSRSRSNS